MEPDLDELNRKDIDGEPAYAPEEIMAGEIVVRNENHGYWNTNKKEPILINFSLKYLKKMVRKTEFNDNWGIPRRIYV